MASIRIESILGGHSTMSNFATKNQFRASLGIDPSQPIDDADSIYSTVASGWLRPTPSAKISGTTITSAPLWMVPNPKDGNVYVYDANSSAYTLDTVTNTVTALADHGTLSGTGNGAAYLDNYQYYATPTDITRYGPLNGVPVWQVNFWTSSLAMSALTNTTYPTTLKNNIQLPNHFLHRHSDGKLYIADVVGNNGTLHYIATTKTSVEGDTNNVSTASKLTFGYGLWPTAIESYGSSIAVALIESSITKKRDPVAKLAFWDTTSSAFNQITWVEYPDSMITAMTNANGVLYVASGNYKGKGFRITKFVGGYSFQQVYYSETGEPPLPGAFKALLNQILIGTNTTIPASNGVVSSIGLQKDISGGVFNIMQASAATSSTTVTAMIISGDNGAIETGFYVPTIGTSQAGDGSTGVAHGIDQQTTYGNSTNYWWSQVFNIGVPFNINRVRIPLAQAVAANMTITPRIYFDNGLASSTLTAINNTTFPNSERIANIRTNNNGANIGRGQINFWIELAWSGTALLTAALPITIEFDVVPD